MYDTERQRMFAALTSRAIKQLTKGPDYRTKDLSKKNLHDSVMEGVLTGIDAVLDGLGKEIGRIMVGTSTKKGDDVAEAFQLGLASVRRLMGVADVKSGEASWVAYATAGLPMPAGKQQMPPGWEDVFGSEEKAEEKSAEPEEYFWVTKAREKAASGASPDRRKFLEDAKAIVASDPGMEAIKEILDLAEELFPDTPRKDLLKAFGG